ncbi:nucleotide exchange factor GrpE [Risungbinella massiliensis]|uniref:nucleotide exchange factor GrpE n=1 Tax=Risungbinella massiliensis TaxID=1329796 RepID=UPI0005CBBF93|nr:nucleotide exchange factor GrpE [Risungbinella massiliensis]
MGPRKENHRFYEQGSQLPQAPPTQQASRFMTSRERSIQKAREGKPVEQRQQQQVLSFLGNLQSNFTSLVRLVEKRLTYDRTKEVAFERLYQEMDVLKQDQELNQLRPLYIDLILFHDRMENIYKDAIDSGKVSPELTELLKSLNGELMEILYRRGVEPIILTSYNFDPKYQEVVKTEPTYDREEDNLIVDIVRNGFKYKDVILRPTKVIIKKYQG